MAEKRRADDDYVMQPMFTYLGNKRKLLPFIRKAVEDVVQDVGRPLRALDAFCGSTVVSRMLASYCTEIHTNDLEMYSYVAAKCFLERPSDEQQKRIINHLAAMNSITEYRPGVITGSYAPDDTQNIRPGERCYFTHENALRVDTWRQYVEDRVEEDVRSWCLCPILIQMSLRANTYGHFKAFSKDKNNVGSFVKVGARATDPMVLEAPVFNPNQCTVTCHNEDAVTLLARLAGHKEKPFDLIYCDPPYNSHEYCAFYFLHNVVIQNALPANVNAVTGLPKERHKSDFNGKKAIDAMRKLLELCVSASRITLISYNDEGIIKPDDWAQLLEPYDHTMVEKDYNRYASNRGVEEEGSRTEVKERLYRVSAKRL